MYDPDDLDPICPAFGGGPGSFRKPGVRCFFDDPYPYGPGPIPASPTPSAAPLDPPPRKNGDPDHPKPPANPRKAPPKKPHHHPTGGGSSLTAAFNKAKELGWLPGFEKAAKASNFSTATLLAVAYRETRLNPVYLKKGGDVHADGAHGFGLMQMDIGSYKSWIDSGQWHTAEGGITKGASILAGKRAQMLHNVGKTVTIRAKHGKISFTGAKMSAADLLRVTVASYNCGMWAYYHFSKGHDVDQGTTGKDYSKDVLQNVPRFEKLLGGVDGKDAGARPDDKSPVTPPGPRLPSPK